MANTKKMRKGKGGFDPTKKAESSVMIKPVFQADVDEYEFVYGLRKKEDSPGLDSGESVVFNILSVSDDEVSKVWCRKALVQYANGETFIKAIPTPKPEELGDMVDDGGNLVAECKASVLYRFPVWVRYILDEKDTVVEEVNELKWINIGPGIHKDMLKIMASWNDDTEVDEGCVPPYSFKLTNMGKNKAKDEISPYVISAFKKMRVGGKGKDDEFFGLELADFPDDVLAKIGEGWDDLIAHLAEKHEAEIELDAVRSNFRYAREESATGRSRGIDSSVVDRVLEAAGDDDSSDEDVEEVTEAPVKERSPRRFARPAKD